MPHIEEFSCLPLTTLPSRLIAVGRCPPASNTRLTCKHFVAGVTVLIGLLKCHRPWSNDGQITRKYVDELRQLIERSVAKKAAYVRNARVIVDLLFATPLRQLLRIHVLLRVLVSVRNHGAKFEDIDRLTALTDSLLAEERLSRRVNLNGDACSYDGDGQHRANASRKHNVERSLEDKIGRSTFLGGGGQRIGSRRPIASCCHETLRRSRVLDGRWKFRRKRGVRAILPINDLIDHRRTTRNISYIFCFIRHVLFQDFVPGPGILPVLYSVRQQLGDRLFDVSHHTLLVGKHC